MADDREIIAKIVKLQSRIDAHKVRRGSTHRQHPYEARIGAGSVKPIAAPSPEGSCSRGNQCPRLHDVNKIALCPSVLRGRDCSAGDECDLSHQPLPETTPTCVHYLRGACTKSPCRYAHAAIDASAPLCRDFAYLGYCTQGATCGGRHLRQCPDYTTQGSCKKARCSLPHIDRASQMRKKANLTEPLNHVEVDDEQDRELQADTEPDMFDMDERNDLRGQFHLEHISGMGTGNGEFSQQHDFVRFS